MKIIEPGLEFTPPTWRLRCGTCKTLMEYGHDDIQGDQREGDYVRCPNCRAWIAHTLAHRVDPIGRRGTAVVTSYYNM